MSGRHGQSGAHRDVHVPWRVQIVCWWLGHDLEPVVGPRKPAHCRRCDRNARTPVELP